MEKGYSGLPYEYCGENEHTKPECGKKKEMKKAVPSGKGVGMTRIIVGLKKKGNRTWQPIVTKSKLACHRQRITQHRLSTTSKM